MWHLGYLPEERKEKYLNLIFDEVKKKRDILKNDIGIVYDYLTNKKLEELLISKLDILYSELNIADYKTKIFINNDYEDWLKAKSKKKRNRNKVEQDFVDKYEKIIQIFDYKNFISGDKAYEIAELIGVNTCVYCNRQYAFTVRNEEKNIVRPDFDHYLSQGKFPFFALSLYNLIPSCLICNRTLKGTKKLDPEMNPYLTDGKKDYFRFSSGVKNLEKDELPSSVEITDIDIIKKEKVKKLLKYFKIQEIYNAHKDFELKDMHIFAKKYCKTYLEALNKGLGLDLSQEEAYRILFGTELLKEKDNNRPLSKFKRDILRELGVI